MLPSVLRPTACLPWQLVFAAAYYGISHFRVRETIQTNPVRSDPAAMQAYCQEVRARGSHDKGWQMQMARERTHIRAIRAMKDFPDQRDLNLICGHSLCSISIFNAETSTHVARAGGARALMAAGLGFYGDPEVTQMATGGLGCLADEVPENRRLIASLGGIQYGLDSWVRHPNHTGALFGVCAMFAGISYENPQNKRNIAFDSDWLDWAFEAIRRFPKSDDRVREEVMQAFNGLTGRPAIANIQRKLLEKGLLEAIATVLRENIDHLNTLTNTNRVVGNLASGDIGIRKLVLQSEIPALLVQTLGVQTAPGWATYVDVDLSAVQALSLLSDGDGNAAVVAGTGCIPKLEELQKKKPGMQSLQHLLHKLRHARPQQ